MKALIIYYSRTGNTKTIAENLAKLSGFDIEEIKDTQGRTGFIGFMRSGYQAYRKKLTLIEHPLHDPADYDLILIGTPVWAGTLSVPVRTYIHEYTKKFPNVAFFSTNGNEEQAALFREMEELCGKKPINTLSIPGTTVQKGEYMDSLKQFLKSIQ